VAIRVIPVSHLRKYVEGNELLDLEGWGGRTARELIEHLGIPSVIVGAVLVDGRLVRKDSLLQDGTEVKLVPLLGGG
jgi:sulfur carrier protein ThiS